MEKTIHVIIEVLSDGKVDLTFYEPESGDCEVYPEVPEDEIEQIAGNEIRSWVGIMKDEMEDLREDAEKYAIMYYLPTQSTLFSEPMQCEFDTKKELETALRTAREKGYQVVAVFEYKDGWVPMEMNEGEIE